LAKYDASGNVVWVRQVKGGPAHGAYIAVEPSGICHIVGTMAFQADFGGGLVVTNSGVVGDLMFSLPRMTQQANALQAREMGTGGEVIPSGIVVDSLGNSYVAGRFQHSSTITFGNTTLINNGFSSVFLTKNDSSNNVVWASGGLQWIEGGSVSAATSVAVDATGNSYLAVIWNRDQVDFGGIMLTNLQGSPADTMGFMAKYDRYGNILWARNVFGTNNSQMGFTAIAEDRWQNVFAVGACRIFSGWRV